MTTCAEFCSIFDLSSKEEIFGLKEVNHDFKESFRTDCLEDKSPEDVHLLREVSDKMVCSACRCAFVNREEQKEHYKLDWHRFNLRQKVSGLNPLTAEEFEKKTGAGDLSSISGSESDSEEEDFACKSGETRNNVVGTDDESSAMTGRLSSKVVFQNSAGAYLMVYQAALMGKTKEEVDAVFSMKSISQKTVWVILVTGGGHFAGAVFEGHRKRKRRKKEGKQLKEEKSNTEAENQEEEEHEATPVEENTQSSTKRKTKAQSKKQDDVESREYGLRDALFTACKVGDVGALSSLLQLPQEMPDSCEELESNPSLVLSPVSLLTKPVDSSGFTLLHVAAAAAQKAVVRLLLDAGADPACRDKKGQTPYTVTPDKETRNIFRKYMGENPDKYDYSRAQVKLSRIVSPVSCVKRKQGDYILTLLLRSRVH
uniref:Ankyrin repeat and zinc finger domain containing 1 n=1 Tax=Nothobranchius kadleci TaxID=1051664 RepID=A0A1A8CA38_NOTKA